MHGKIAVITGAKGGLGSAVTKAFLDAGVAVAGVSRSISAADFSHPNFHPFSADITQPGPTRELITRIASALQRIDILIHIAGGFAFARVEDTDDDTWTRMRDLNLSSGFYLAREVIPIMRRQNFGRIIAIGSLAATEPHAGIGAYVASKTALHALFRTIALEMRDAGITSNVILPGTMNTPGNRAAMPDADFTKWVEPSDVAKVALMLAQEDAGSLTGAMIPVSPAG